MSQIHTTSTNYITTYNHVSALCVYMQHVCSMYQSIIISEILERKPTPTRIGAVQVRV